MRATFPFYIIWAAAFNGPELTVVPSEDRPLDNPQWQPNGRGDGEWEAGDDTLSLISDQADLMRYAQTCYDWLGKPEPGDSDFGEEYWPTDRLGPMPPRS
jgi:hypothetical protein